MENAFEIIVLILSGMLFIFLVIFIVALSYIIKLVKALRALADKGEVLVNKAESIGDAIREKTYAFNLVRIITNLTRIISNVKKG